ncbi:MAG: alpha/beta hydrolase-fold protein [Candidatus Eisenbacteria bacterium]
MLRSRLTTLVRLAALMALVLTVPTVHAATVSNLQAVHRSGQTFITWDNIPGSGWLYHVYASPTPIQEVAALDNATELAIVGDHSSVDQRISMLLGQTMTFRIDPGQAPLPLSRGLFVATPVASQYTFYVVIAQQVGMREDRTLVPGQNLLPDPVSERMDRPRPVWQRRLTSPAGEDYVLWTANSGTPLFPAMCNAPGRAFHVGIIPGQKGGALLLHGHGRGGNFFNSFLGTGTPGEWVMSIDDYLPTGDYSSFYFGYEANYDTEQPLNVPRTDGGMVVDYTEQRVLYLLDWANETMPHDPQRVYAMGVSMGGSFAFFLAWHHPDRIAGALSVIPKICLAYRPDVFPELRTSLDRLWGSPDLDLPTTAGERVFQWMDGREQARIERHRGSAPIVGFAGLNDNVVGWGEKVAYFESMEANRAGGSWFWDQRGHYTPHEQTEWFPMMATRQLYKYRIDRSYPAFSNCSTNSDPGTGDPVTADPIGNINGAVDWIEDSVGDEWLRWDISLRTRPLVTQDGVLGAPESLLVDVTPRRLQRFLVAERVAYLYEVRRTSDEALVQSGIVTPDNDAVITVPQVKVFAQGTRLTLMPTTTTGVDPSTAGLRRPHLSLSRNPVQGKASLVIAWPGEGDASVDLFDMQGRVVRHEFAGVARGHLERTFRTDGLAPGVYMITARQGSTRSTKRVTVLH